ncbi:MAG: deoxyribonuclease V [Rhodospirillales bacterium]|jgi:deoxyribonuclease V|nr:deoxyribonuclease V [Rhodospirillales bacterium]
MALQTSLAARVVRDDACGEIRRVAGVDVAYGRRAAATARAAVVVLELPALAVVDEAVAEAPITFPYVPGLLSFREAPAAIAALERLTVLPDMLLCDGQGLAHPRRLGFASHLGLYLDLPSIGVAKSRLIGTHAPPADVRGAHAPLIDRGEVIGAALRTRPGTAPIYVSIGHRVSLATAIATTLRCTTRFRLPETTRRADRLSKRRD